MPTTWNDVYDTIGMTKADQRLHRMLARRREVHMCTLAHASDLIEFERDTSPGHCEALQDAITRAEQDELLSVADIQIWHAKCFPYGGRFRTTNAYLRGSVANLTPPREIMFAVHNWVMNVNAFLSDRRRNPDDTYTWIAKLHVEFERIHPFPDGNGRLGRILVNYMLVYCGLPPTKLALRDRERYINALEQDDYHTLAQLFFQGAYPL